MSEKLCALRKIGGGMSETVLWSNSAPSSSFIGQSVTLNQSIEGFKEIRFYFRCTTTNSKESFVTYSVEEFKTYLLSQTTFSAALSYRHNGTQTYVRTVFYTDSTHIYVGGAYYFQTGNTDNTTAIPTKIVGLK